PDASESLIASAYMGYLMGVLVSLNAQRICARLGSEINSAILGILTFGAGFLLFTSTNLFIIIFAVFIFSTGFFLMHSTLSAYINHHTQSQRGIANGLYIAFYYTGGSLGSYFPLIIYHNWGWYPYLMLVMTSTMLGLAIVLGLHKAEKKLK
ncbi:MAG: MFS transporter, partial [Candidatus Marinimicrobia bacterium]|nr:MFS transporter [Candidatus Neomarinimicrobiota bacterium]